MQIKLPILTATYLDRDKNTVRQFIAPATDVEVEVSSYNSGGVRGYVLNETDGDLWALVVGPVGSIPNGFEYVIRLKEFPVQLPADISSGEWVRHPQTTHILSNPPTTSAIVDSWRDSFSYKEEDESMGILGLRAPQIGALHAIHAHWVVSDEAATIVMPTGTGKTEVMLSTLISTRCPKVLVIVPTDTLRNQIADKFLSLGILKEAGIIPVEYQYPIVGILKTKPRSQSQLDEIFDRCNVVVTTINIAGQLPENLRKRLAHHCQYLFIDEAHHIGARTWRELKEAFQDKRILQFTATPFRNDDLAVEGKIIFKYSLRKAFENGYFKKIHFRPIREFNPENADRAIAAKAVEQLRRDPASHILMARVDSIDKADKVFEIYQSYPEFNPVRIHNRRPTREREESRRKILSGESRIVICVDMLGEGFDLPELKIAAFHDIRKSLAVTLQIAGRFTRSRSDLGEATFIANIADVNVDNELKKLYVHDADWNFLLEQSSETAIGEQQSLQEYSRGFQDFPKDIPFQNLHPATSMVVYKTRCTQWQPQKFKDGLRGLGSLDKIRNSLNPQENTLVIVTAKKIPVDWIRLDEVFNWDWELHILFWDRSQNLLFIHSSSNAGYFLDLAKAVAGDDVELINGENVFRALAGIKRLILYNVGLKKQLGRLIKYTMQAGSDVESGLSDAQLRNARKSNLFGMGYENGEKMTIGCSTKGRIWSHRTTNIDYLAKWCSAIGKKLIDNRIHPEEILRGTLKPQTVSTRPRSIPVRVDWPEEFYVNPEADISFVFGTNPKVPLFNTSIVLKDPSSTGNICFKIESAEHSAEFSLELSESGENRNYRFVHSGGEPLKISSRSKEMDAVEFFYDHPPEIYFADGSSLEGNIHTPLNIDPAPLENGKIEVWDWTGTDIRKESQGVLKASDSIQYKVIERLRSGNYNVIINDDGKGEIADVVAIKILEEDSKQVIDVSLYHCKYSSASTPGARIDDLYVVCGQAQTSANWKANPSRFFSHFLRRGPLRENGQEVSRFEVGDENLLEQIRGMSEFYEVRMRVYLVQPGVSKAQISEAQRKLLGVTENYLLETYELPFKAVISR